MSKVIKSVVSGAIVAASVAIGTKFLIMLGIVIDPSMIGTIIVPTVFFGSTVGFYVMGIIYNDEIQN